MKYETKVRTAVNDTLGWFRSCDFALAEIARESGIHIASLTGRVDGPWNPGPETLIKLGRARDRLEKRERDAIANQLKSETDIEA